MRNRKPPESKKEWSDLTLFYCSKRETSEHRLRLYLHRKLREYRVPIEEAKPHLDWIEEVLRELVGKKIIDDSRYAGILERDLKRRGKGRRYIEQKMKERGLQAEIETLSFDSAHEEARALELIERLSTRSSIRKALDERERKTRLLQKLLAHGFDLGVSKRAIAEWFANRSPEEGPAPDG